MIIRQCFLALSSQLTSSLKGMRMSKKYILHTGMLTRRDGVCEFMNIFKVCAVHGVDMDECFDADHDNLDDVETTSLKHLYPEELPFDYGSEEPYNEDEIANIPCVRCGKPSHAQWNICANNGLFSAVCVECDIALNRTVLNFCRFPDVDKMIETYTTNLNKP